MNVLEVWFKAAFIVQYFTQLREEECVLHRDVAAASSTLPNFKSSLFTLIFSCTADQEERKTAEKSCHSHVFLRSSGLCS